MNTDLIITDEDNNLKPKKAEEQPSDSPFIVKQVNPNSTSVAEALGIDNNRDKELVEICKDAYLASDKVSEAIERASKYCKNANELVMIVKHIGTCQLKEEDDPMKALMQILGTRRK